MIGIALASVYHVIGVLAALVCFSFMVDIYAKIKAEGDSLLGLPRKYLQGWVWWLKALPDDFRAVLGIIPPKVVKQHPYGVGYPLEVGIAHTAAAWAGMALYWSEKNIAWMGTLQDSNPFMMALPFVWSWAYGRGYMMHLKTVWCDHAWRWRLFLLASIIYVPLAVYVRS